MPFTFEVEVDGQHELDIAFKRVHDELTDFRKFWPSVAAAFYDIEIDQFNTQGARGGQKWAPLSESTLRSRRGEWDPASEKILRRSNDLFRSLTRRGDANAVYEEEPQSLTLGSSLPYAVFHQRGTGKMPARPPIQLTAADVGKLKRAFVEPVAEVVKRAGFESTGAFDLRNLETEEVFDSNLDFVDDL